MQYSGVLARLNTPQYDLPDLSRLNTPYTISRSYRAGGGYPVQQDRRAEGSEIRKARDQRSEVQRLIGFEFLAELAESTGDIISGLIF
jgi:hypothetical protein